MIEAKEIEVSGKKYIISKIPSMDGFEIIVRFGAELSKRAEDYTKIEEVTLKLLSYCQVRVSSDHTFSLSTRDMINNHVKTVWDVFRLQKAMIDYNFDFFVQERISIFWEELTAKLPSLVSKMLADSLAPLFQNVSQHSVNLSESTA